MSVRNDRRPRSRYVNGIRRPKKADWKPGWWQPVTSPPTRSPCNSRVSHVCVFCTRDAVRKAKIAARRGHIA